ncbi:MULTISPECIES: pantetheine-phosphate adenylyltransferase [Bacillaceae]|uniref:Phosphopantetheine adenylyltransferase n=1 Tax=Domibacillus aminovorans TaxID=29332 RepID=A0A177L605_9BACI|nr:MULTISPECIES: pantetheine-phosphate adenylyltransferase [Bacillaceae]OAH52867.1 phosphopantetheine adenylyltransferase [Domibacillus aminovorans]OAH60796.1 phosphopantetheine adenylyltransferase [Domibacillus aminovorans]
MKAIYPGSFDPITNGHIDIVNRASHFFDEIIVAVLVNSKKQSLFSIGERSILIENEFTCNEKVKVVTFQGLLVDYMKENNIKAIIKGLRTVTDYGYEAQMALINKQLYREAETFFIHSSEKYSFLSSSIVKNIYSHDGSVSDYVPNHVEKALKEKLKQQS